MGVDICAYMKVEELRRVICENEDFCLLMEFISRTSGLRWDAFLNAFGLDYYKMNITKLTSKELVNYFDKYDSSLLDRQSWFYLISTYDIIFVPDNIDFEEPDYVELLDFEYCVEDVVCSQFKDIIEKCDTYHVKNR